MNDCNEITEEVLNYCSNEYNYIVFSGKNVIGDRQFWTLEKTEADAIKRCKNETEAYGEDSDYNFTYHPLVRQEKKYHHKPEPVTVVLIDYQD